MKDNVVKAINRRYVIVGVIVLCVAVGVLFYLYASKSVVGDRAAKVYELSLGHNMPPGTAMYIAAQRFADTVRDKTNGRVKINISPAQQLGDDYRMIEMAVNGQLDILISPAAKLSVIMPAMQYTDIPFLFPRIEDAYAMLDGQPGALLLERLKQEGLVGAAFWGNGFKQFTANRPVYSPQDLDGMNVRIIKNEVVSDQFIALGAKPVPIDLYKAYDALKNREIDAQENSIAAIYGFKFYEVQSNLIISNHAYMAYVFCFSQKTLSSLPDDIVQTLMITARELRAFERELIAKQEQDYIKAIKEAGVNVIYLNDRQLRQFQNATKHIIDKYRTIAGQDIIDLTLAYLKQKYNYENDNDIIIGLNADMSMAAATTGMAIRRGMELAVEEINARGGVLGRKLAIVVMDHKVSSDLSEKNVRSLSKMKNLVAIMGGIHGMLIMSDIELIHKEKLIYLVPWAASDKITNNSYNPNYVFRVSINDEKAGHFLIQQALKKSEKIAFLLVNNEWGKENGRIMSNSLRESNLTPSAVEFFNMGEEDVRQQAYNIEDSDAEVLIVIGTAFDRTAIMKALALLKRKIPLLSHMAFITGGYIPEQLKGVNLSFIQTFSSFLNPDDELTRRVLRQYLDTYHVSTAQEIPVPAATAQAYDLVNLLVMAINDAGTFDRPAIRNSLENIKTYHGLVKTYSPPFTKTRHDALDINDYFMAKYDRHGIIVPIDKRSR
ncbi:DctP family TRAP transporter solute-binding subunit [Candidatus Magnetobacterium casense]|uniref:DctP family TRAP transporter solute-binding subunit n=1 Tax=Candidatus Magnetobacterium casense TaxID=1455061 RepID=A0ABS6RYA2_9BACT|nr:DctP family TRAP transporter solute-binding subunit [Candidatus Magnetobacterium casensis]MBV6341611.1 DctP family TRAP transporter solute-binding subunit [Candidatus Magnetobacterium casensis]